MLPADRCHQRRYPATVTKPRFRVVPAAYVLLRRLNPDDQVLLQLRQGTGYMDGYWASSAAGHVEAGESVVDAGCREAVEELGITIDPADLTALCAMHRTGGNHRAVDERVDFFFECRRWSGEPQIHETDKVADLKWFSVESLPHPVVAHELAVLEQVRSGRIDSVVTFGFCKRMAQPSR